MAFRGDMPWIRHVFVFVGRQSLRARRARWGCLVNFFLVRFFVFFLDSSDAYEGEDTSSNDKNRQSNEYTILVCHVMLLLIIFS